MTDSNFIHRRPAAIAPEGPTSITEQTAMLMLERQVDVAARCALGDGLPAEAIADLLKDMARAILNPGQVVEDMSPIRIYMA